MVPEITAVGSVGLDTVTTPEGTRTEMLGGSVIHFAVSASFQTKVGIVGVVGGDFPEEHIDFLKERGIDYEGLEIVEDRKTFRWSGSYLKDLNAAETHCTALNVFADFEPEIPEEYKQAPVLFLANIHPSLQLHVIDQMAESCYRVCDTMNLWIRETREDLIEVFKKVNVAIVNDGEAKMFTGEDNLIKAGRHMLEFGLEYCIIKKGEHGALAFGRDGFFAAVPSYPIETVFDPTGAGDSFAGGFTGYLARTGEHTPEAIIKAMRWGTIMGSFNVTDFSCDSFRKITIKEIEHRLAELEKMIGI
jgi:sugar/nucleoside kinase (ribokinase family)